MLSEKRGYVIVNGSLDLSDGHKLNSLGFPGIVVENSSVRSYPNGSMATSVLAEPMRREPGRPARIRVPEAPGWPDGRYPGVRIVVGVSLRAHSARSFARPSPESVWS